MGDEGEETGCGAHEPEREGRGIDMDGRCLISNWGFRNGWMYGKCLAICPLHNTQQVMHALSSSAPRPSGSDGLVRR